LEKHYVLPFKAMVIMASYYFFHSYERQGIQTKNPFDEIFNLSFDFRPLKVNNNASERSQFCKGLSKGLIQENTFDGENIKKIKTF
jgi:hypothetical protein